MTSKFHQMTEIYLGNANYKPETTVIITNKTDFFITKHIPNTAIRELYNPEPQIYYKICTHLYSKK